MFKRKNERNYRRKLKQLTLLLIGFHLEFYYRRDPKCKDGQFYGTEMWQCFAPQAHAIYQLISELQKGLGGYPHISKWAEDLLANPPIDIQEHVSNTHMHSGTGWYPIINLDSIDQLVQTEYPYIIELPALHDFWIYVTSEIPLLEQLHRDLGIPLMRLAQLTVGRNRVDDL